VVPAMLDEIWATALREVPRAMEAMLKMKKIDIGRWSGLREPTRETRDGGRDGGRADGRTTQYSHCEAPRRRSNPAGRSRQLPPYRASLPPQYLPLFDDAHRLWHWALSESILHGRPMRYLLCTRSCWPCQQRTYRDVARDTMVTDTAAPRRLQPCPPSRPPPRHLTARATTRLHEGAALHLTWSRALTAAGRRDRVQAG